MLSILMMDAAPSPQVFLYMALGLGGFFIVIGLITVSVMLIVKAIKKKTKLENNDIAESRHDDK